MPRQKRPVMPGNDTAVGNDAAYKFPLKHKQLDNFVMNYLQQLLNTSCNTYLQHKGIQFYEGTKVVCLMHGLYYSATARMRYRMCKPDTMYKRGEDVPVERQVLSYVVNLDHWPRMKKYDYEVPENELIGCETDSPVAVVGMLTAYLWNSWKRAELGDIPDKDMGPGVWLLDDEEYEDLQRIWRKQSRENISFVEFVSRTYAERTGAP
ncbi:hypothetical protein BV898_07605 [Hypsibius exemplaris]|uniref:Uncharacterized protein n=1 Tax=Hypsibius exemplaris TaxID=2072580 RepID=A0A1W0WT81_HYPEX|nr:hypothetical protein BV898_07605 [Hypsibius exemplaris]